MRRPINILIGHKFLSASKTDADLYRSRSNAEFRKPSPPGFRTATKPRLQSITFYDSGARTLSAKLTGKMYTRKKTRGYCRPRVIFDIGLASRQIYDRRCRFD